MPRFTIRLALVAITVLGSVAAAADKGPSTAEDVLGGREVVQTILEAKKAVVFRLKGETLKSKPAEYEVLTGPLAVDGNTAQQLAQTVTAYRTYEREIALGCEPVFGVRTTFAHEKNRVDVVYCFDCDLLAVYLNDKRVGDGCFAPGRAKLVALTKTLLPKDEVIQGLK